MVLNEVLSLNAQECSTTRTDLVICKFLNEVLSLNAQEFYLSDLFPGEGDSSMKS